MLQSNIRKTMSVNTSSALGYVRYCWLAWNGTRHSLLLWYLADARISQYKWWEEWLTKAKEFEGIGLKFSLSDSSSDDAWANVAKAFSSSSLPFNFFRTRLDILNLNCFFGLLYSKKRPYCRVYASRWLIKLSWNFRLSRSTWPCTRPPQSLVNSQ